MIFLKSACPILRLLKTTYLNLVSIKDYLFKEKSEWPTPSSLQITIRKPLFSHTQSGLALTRLCKNLYVSPKSQSSCLFPQNSHAVTDDNHLRHHVSYPWSGVHIIQPTMQRRFPLSRPRGFRPPANWVNSLCMSDRQKIIGEERVWFPVRSLQLPLTSLEKRTETLRILLGIIFASQTMLPLFSFCSVSLYCSLLLSFCMPVFLPFSLPF